MVPHPAVTIVAVHGNGGGAFRWDLLAKPLADDVELRGPSLPGFSGRPLPSGPVTMATFADALIDELESADETRILLGHGIGGALALDVAANQPALVDGLILHAPVAVNLDSRLFPKLMASMAVRKTAKATISSWPVRLAARRFAFEGAPRPYAEQFFAEYGNAEAFEVMFDLLTAEWFESLPAITSPAVVLWGEKDRVLQVEQAEAVESRLPNSRRHIEPEWGHYPMIEKPVDYQRVLVELARAIASETTEPS